MKLSLSSEIHKAEELEMDSAETEKILLASNEALQSAFMNDLALTKFFLKNYLHLYICNNYLVIYFYQH